MAHKLGLVFAGGGGKGPYEIGVWKALDKLGLTKDIAAVSGTSVGALNAALFAQGDIEKAEKAWLSMSPCDVLSFDFKRAVGALFSLGVTLPQALILLLHTTARYGVFSREGLERIMNEYLDETALSNRGISCFACATRMSTFKPAYFSLQGQSKDKIKKILLASSAIPGVFQSEKLEEGQYLDGFLTDNIPIKPLIEIGCSVVIVVMLSRSDLLPIDLYPSCKIIPIYPQGNTGFSLNFNDVSSKIQRGYEDAIFILEPVFDLIEMNYQYSVELQAYKKQHQDFQKEMEISHSLGEDLAISQENLLKELKKW